MSTKEESQIRSSTEADVESAKITSTESQKVESGTNLGGNARPSTVSAARWLHVINGFVVFFNTWGLLLSFGGFQSYYRESMLADHSESELSWISTFCAFVLLGGGLVTGPLFDAGHLRYLLLGGIVLQVLGLMMTSLSTQYYQVFLAQGLCIGLGGSFVYVPSIAAAAASFDAKTRPIIMGIVASGTGVGGVVYPIIFRQLVTQVGFAWTVRAIGFLVLGTYLVAGAVVFSQRQQPTAVRMWIDMSALKELPFACILVAAFFSGAGYYLPLLYLPQFTDTAILHQSNSELSFYILSIVNGVSVIGRLVAGPIAAKFGPVETATGAIAGCGIILFAWIPVSTVAGIIVWGVFWGLVSSVVVALPGAIIPLMTPSVSLIGTRLGMYWLCVGLGVLVGSPIGGALASGSSGTLVWWHIQIFAGLLMTTTAVLFVYPAIIVHRRTRQARLSSQ